MSSKEIATRILEKFNSAQTFIADLSNGKISAKLISSTLKFDIIKTKPKNTEEVLDWFLISKEQIIEVLQIILKDKDIGVITNRVTDFIEAHGLTEANELYLVPYLDHT